MDVSLVLALITLLTNKPYLGWPRHTWDASLLGAVLIAIAIAVRRWLSRGPGGERNGFTAVRLLDRDRAVLSLVSTASVLVQPGVAPSRTEPAASEFSGGRSGGGGGGDSF
jgi:predicted small integral membrane protein